MTDHDHTPADGCSWGRCTRCGGWIWQAMGACYSVRQSPGYPHEVVAGPWSGAGACQCPPAAPSPDPAGEASEIARLQREVDALLSDERMACDLARETVGETGQTIDSAFTASLALYQLVARLRAERDRLRDAGDRLIAVAARDWTDDRCPPSDAWEAAADAWMVAREVKP